MHRTPAPRVRAPVAMRECRRITSYNVCYTKLLRSEGYDFMNSITLSIDGKKVLVPETHKELAYRINLDIDELGALQGNESLLVLNLLPKLKASIKINLEVYDNALEWLNTLAEYKIRPRITSYNVCYTKLLRTATDSPLRAASRIRRCGPILNPTGHRP